MSKARWIVLYWIILAAIFGIGLLEWKIVGNLNAALVVYIGGMALAGVYSQLRQKRTSTEARTL